MKRCSLIRPIAQVALVLPLVPAVAAGDLIRLNSGGEVRGTIVTPVDDATDSGVIVVETLSGGTIAVRKDDVRFVTRRPRIVEEHERKSALAADTVESHWELAEWCRVNSLEEQRLAHLERIVELETDHADARRALGQVKHEDEWMTRDEVMRKRGLVRHRNRWITKQELELIEKTAAEREREQAWFTDVRGLKTRLRSSQPRLRQEAYDALKAIRDPDAVPALANNFDNDADPVFRNLYVSILAEIPGVKPVEPLVKQLLHDVDVEVRRAALAAISEPQYDAALPYLVQGLRHSKNDVVRRAAAALEQIGDHRAVPELMKALITTHRYRVAVPDTASTYSFSHDGAFGPGGTPLPPAIAAGMRAGALPYGVSVVDLSRPARTRMVTVSVNQENPEVLSALRAITGEQFGFDERTWRLWWASKKNGFG